MLNSARSARHAVSTRTRFTPHPRTFHPTPPGLWADRYGHTRAKIQEVSFPHPGENRAITTMDMALFLCASFKAGLVRPNRSRRRFYAAKDFSERMRRIGFFDTEKKKRLVFPPNRATRTCSNRLKATPQAPYSAQSTCPPVL